MPHPMPESKAASAEGRYIAESGDIWEDPPQKPIPINLHRALIVQQVYNDRLTQPERKVLQAEYPHRTRYLRPTKTGAVLFDTGAAARKLGLPLRVYKEMLNRAARFVGEALALRP